MDLTLNNAVMGVELSGIRQFTYLVRDTPGACALTIGEPDLNTPDVIKEAAKAALDANDTHYPPGNGYPYALEAISKFEAEAHGLHYAPSEVILTVGATEALFASFSTILNPGDEVIIPTPAFGLYEALVQLQGGVPVSLPTEHNHFQIVPEELKAAITDKTKVIVAMHYAGVACEMDTIMDIARRHNLMVVEDAAQGVMSSYKGKALGTIGDFGCYSFHETKNYSMGEGGALVINNPDYNERAEILREKGTNRAKFFRGQVDKYTWVDFGDSYLPSELNAAYLWAQLLHADEINENRLTSWHRYREAFMPLAEADKIELQHIPAECTHNAHMFYLKCKNLEERTEFIRFLKENDILAVFHYIPLHSAPAGEKFGRFDGEDVYTTAESERLVRLPLYYGLTEDDQNKVIAKVLEFYEK